MTTLEEIEIFERVLIKTNEEDRKMNGFPKRGYIRETNYQLHELALYGPFSDDEIEGLLNDAFADAMASGGAEIEEIRLTDEDASKHYINPRTFWMERLATLTE